MFQPHICQNVFLESPALEEGFKNKLWGQMSLRVIAYKMTHFRGLTIHTIMVKTVKITMVNTEEFYSNC